MSVNDKADGGVTVKCFAGCDWKTVRAELAARGLVDAYDPPEPLRPSTRSPGEDRPRWIYRDASGAPVGLVERIDQGPGRKSFCQYRREDEAWVKGLDGRTLPLYRLPECLEAVAAGRVVYVAEGEKAADALVKVGLGATTSPGGADKWRPEHSESLRGARVVILPDNDEPGRRHAEMVARSLAGVAAKINVVPLPGLPPKGDAFDFLEAGGTREQLEALAAAEPARVNLTDPIAKGFTAAQLTSMDFPEPMWAVPGLLTVGLTLLCGKPKQGKSWLALDLCLAVAFGGRALGKYAVGKGSSLYFALEDTPRRLQARLRMVLDGQTAPEGMHLFCQWPRLDQGGAEQLAEWLAAHPDCRLVIVDTLQKIRAPSKTTGTLYGQDYEALSALKAVADAAGVALVVVHHLRKGASDDVFDTVSGTLGLTGAADATLILARTPGKFSATLHCTGRDIEEQSRALELDPRRMTWCDVGDAEERAGSDERQAVLDVLREASGSLSLEEVAKKTRKRPDATRKLLARAADQGLVVRTGKGLYAITQQSYQTPPLSRPLGPDGTDGPESPQRPLGPLNPESPLRPLSPESPHGSLGQTDAADARQSPRETSAQSGQTPERTQRTQRTQAKEEVDL
ncbi:MAG: AAA family ATPase [Deltaproteobacteria bacterium]|nr:AAA family ATPase [Deltaproteobacteria bacterium]